MFQKYGWKGDISIDTTATGRESFLAGVGPKVPRASEGVVGIRPPVATSSERQEAVVD
jgi:hypothetical protein